MKPSYAKYLIEKTKEYFDKNVEGFSGSRKEFWPEFEELKKYIKRGERVLDLGCGNGRLFPAFGGSAVGGETRDIEYIGIDSSEKMIQKAKGKYGNHFQTADIFSLPFSNSYFDSVWMIAVFHHIPSKELQLKALQEIRRVLRKNGRVIMTCWHLFRFPFRKNIMISSKKLKIQRYYHAFTKRELRKLFQKTGFKIEELKYLKRNNKKTNILIVATK